jgi:hypothetical protein
MASRVGHARETGRLRFDRAGSGTQDTAWPGTAKNER